MWRVVKKVKISNRNKCLPISLEPFTKALPLAFIVLFGSPIDAHEIENTHSSKTLLQMQLEKMGYGDVSLSSCWLQFSRIVEPSQDNGWTESYTRIENLDSLLGFSDSEIVKITNSDAIFYGISIRTNLNDIVRPVFRLRFKKWIDTTYQGSDWPYVKTPELQKATPEVEAALKNHFPLLEQLNRWISVSKHGQSTRISDWFQMTSPSRDALVKFKSAIEAYAQEHGCNIEG